MQEESSRMYIVGIVHITNKQRQFEELWQLKKCAEVCNATIE